MKEPILIHKGRAQSLPFPGGGTITKIIYPDTVNSVKLFIGMGEAEPGTSPHRWHRHIRDILGQGEIVYPDDFEEFYYIIKGHGKMQWKTEDGKVHEEPVAEGDAIYLPIQAVEHQILNTGDEKMSVLYGGTPPSRWINK